jgi:hypothetical protein
VSAKVLWAIIHRVVQQKNLNQEGISTFAKLHTWSMENEAITKMLAANKPTRASQKSYSL